MTNNFSIPLQFLIECIKCVLLHHEPTRLIAVSQQENFDWNAVRRFSKYHRIRPIVFAALQKFPKDRIPSAVFSYFSEYMQQQTYYNLQATGELVHLLQEFNKEGIDVLPYKGVLFISEFFNNSQFREVGDSDLLFHPDSIKDGMKILLTKGYSFEPFDKRFVGRTDSGFIDELLDGCALCEVPMGKANLQLDVHWGLHYNFLPYNFDYSSFFAQKELRDFYGHQIYLPSKETLFWMVICHHGSKEMWLQLRHLIDLAAFLDKYGEEVDWDRIFSEAKDIKVYRLTLLGFYLASEILGYKLPSRIVHELGSFSKMNAGRIYAYWEYAKPWNHVAASLKYKRILIENQDPGFSKLKYYYHMYKAYSKPNPNESKRIIEFPEKYTFLNFASKALTYVYERF